MGKEMSVYLDLFRSLLGIAVLITHASFERYHGSWLIPLNQFGHEAVIGFFVLSGFVIAYVSNEKEKSLEEYAISRLARLYSVVLPALVLTLFFDYIGALINAEAYSGWWNQDSSPVLRFLTGFFFLNEIQYTSTRVFTNGPFWSLGYEFWYYVIFAVLFYFTGAVKWLLAFFISLFVGVKILLLFPVWLMGVFVYYINRFYSFDAIVGWLCLIGSVILFSLIKEYQLSEWFQSQAIAMMGKQFVLYDLRWSKGFVVDYLIGICVAINFIGFVSVVGSFSKTFLMIERPVRWFAGYTFSIYLFHYPLLQFFSSFLDYGVAITLLTLLCCIVLGEFTEKKKHWFKAVIVRGVQKYKSMKAQV